MSIVRVLTAFLFVLLGCSLVEAVETSQKVLNAAESEQNMFLGHKHHPSFDEACACCHYFEPSASECFAMDCGDGSGMYCWSPSGGAQGCTTAQMEGTCSLATL
mmetsp:Transcript_22818/g.40398  ORF Transcript_22818/g.40398 Transcript_22818/m.40398 type:complete len:104 (-) Transcript_22818:96-407(-)